MVDREKLLDTLGHICHDCRKDDGDLIEFPDWGWMCYPCSKKRIERIYGLQQRFVAANQATWTWARQTHPAPLTYKGKPLVAEPFHSKWRYGDASSMPSTPGASSVTPPDPDVPIGMCVGATRETRWRRWWRKCVDRLTG